MVCVRSPKKVVERSSSRSSTKVPSPVTTPRKGSGNGARASVSLAKTANVHLSPKSSAISRGGRGGAGRDSRPKALLLGLVYALKTLTENPSTGQMFRDRVRCEAMDKMGYLIHCIDDKHDDDADLRALPNSTVYENYYDRAIAVEGSHCRANFADARRMYNKMQKVWGGCVAVTGYKQIILDYFFCPEGYVQNRWAENFFKDTLPLFAQKNILAVDGQLWLPNLPHVQEMIRKYDKPLREHYEWVRVRHTDKTNPLFEATETVDDVLALCPDGRTNKSQLLPLLQVSDHIFFLFTRKVRTSHSGRVLQ